MENFIFEGFLEDSSLCDRLIAHHKASPKGSGTVFGNMVDAAAKDSTDCRINDASLKTEYIAALQKLTEEYIRMYPMCNYYSAWGIVENINIQHYAPNQGYKAWHTERVSAKTPNASRHLVFLTYLNDVFDGGGTEFMHQGLTTTARKGKTLIWPSDWTFTHRGQVSPTQEKYIVTGWFSYTE